MPSHDSWQVHFPEEHEMIAYLEKALETREQELDEKAKRILELEKHIREMMQSRSWKLAGWLRDKALTIAPIDSTRRRILKIAYRGFKSAVRVGRPAHVVQTLKALIPRSAPSIPPLSIGLPEFTSLPEIDVSIIITVHNIHQETQDCLESIARSTGDRRYEVIIVDDASSRETSAVLRSFKGTVYLHNEQRLGFIRSSDRGAQAACGNYLVFLKPDTIVTPGWLGALADTFEVVPDAGLVGAKIVFPDGRLKEAGGIVWRDASLLDYGHCDDPDHPRYNFLREVDYCTGVCIMLPAALFRQIGGFFSQSMPATYEYIDLAFKIRHRGHKVLYQPRARVVSPEKELCGKSAELSSKMVKQLNQPRFREHWQKRLDGHPEPAPNVQRIVHAHGPGARTNLGQVLVIDHAVPRPDRDSGSFRMSQILRILRSRGHHVTFIPNNLVATLPYTHDLQALGVEIIHEPYYLFADAYLRQHGGEFSLVILSRADIAARHMTAVRRYAPQAKIVFDTVDLHFVREEREATLRGDAGLGDEVSRRKIQELDLVQRADLTLVVSPVEAAILQAECPSSSVRILSNIHPVDTSDRPGFDKRRDIVFIGSFGHPPNIDAVLYFVREVFPRVCGQIPEVVFHIIGSETPEEISQLAGPQIQVHGYLDNVEFMFDRCRLSVAPLRYGAGVKGKVNQSMNLGVPVVVTSIAAEGMHLTHEENALIADEPKAFAESVVRLWRSSDLWHRLVSNGRLNLRNHFSVAAATACIDELLSWVSKHTPVSTK